MSFVTPTANARVRLLITGETGSGKTTSLLTFPARRVVMSYPGEHGYGSLPVGDPDTLVFAWEEKDLQMDSTQVVDEVDRRTREVIAGKHGPVHTFCGDGLHKFYEYILDSLSGGNYFAGSPVQDETKDNPDVLSPKVFGQAKRRLARYLHEIGQSPVPIAVFTAWDNDKGTRKALQGEHWSKVPTAKYPAFFGGTVARDILGEFTTGVVHSSRGRLKPTDTEATWRWQTRPSAGIVAAALKAPKEVATLVPPYVAADWGVLGKFLEPPSGGVSNVSGLAPQPSPGKPSSATPATGSRT